jgi:hypothetical protein
MLSYPTTSRFGQVDNFHPTPHTGIDFAAPAGTPAQSLIDGIVSNVGSNDMLGNNVRVFSNGKEIVYGHLSQINVSPGQQVDTGDVLGLTGGVPGTPGAGHSTGAHIHISALNNGQIVDPTSMLTGQSDSGGFLSNLWHVLVTPGVDVAKESVWVRIVDAIDPIFIIAILGCILLGILGSKKAKKGTFWAVSLYILVKLIVTSL